MHRVYKSIIYEWMWMWMWCWAGRSESVSWASVCGLWRCASLWERSVFGVTCATRLQSRWRATGATRDSTESRLCALLSIDRVPAASRPSPVRCMLPSTPLPSLSTPLLTATRTYIRTHDTICISFWVHRVSLLSLSFWVHWVLSVLWVLWVLCGECRSLSSFNPSFSIPSLVSSYFCSPRHIFHLHLPNLLYYSQLTKFSHYDPFGFLFEKLYSLMSSKSLKSLKFFWFVSMHKFLKENDLILN